MDEHNKEKKQWHSYKKGKITFYGVWEKYAEDVNKEWGAATIEQYEKDYEDFIFPYLDEKPLEEYGVKDFEEILEKLPERRIACKHRRQKEVTDEYRAHILWIIKRVLKVADQKGECPNVLWGSKIEIEEDPEKTERLEKEFVKLRKSLSIDEEIKVAQHVMLMQSQETGQGSEVQKAEEQEGENFGLALMFCLGLRNSEACSATFGDIHPLECDPSVYCLWVYKTPEKGSGIQRFGGKTKNVGRIIPIPSRLKGLLEKRRKMLLQKVLRGEVAPPELSDDDIKELKEEQKTREGMLRLRVDRLHIACVGQDYTKGCSARHLTLKGTALLKCVQVDEEMVSFIDYDIKKQRRTAEGILEKDPTAYLLRRNLGTHLYLLGLDDSEIQYIMGHEIEDESEERNYYRNEEKLYPIALKMARRPLVNNIESEPIQVQAPVVEQNVVNQVYRLPVSPVGTRYKIYVWQKERDSGLKIRFTHRGVHATGSQTQYRNGRPYTPTLSVIRQYHKKYQDAESKKNPPM